MEAEFKTPAHRRAQNREYAREHVSENRARARQWKKDNSERAQESSARWYQENRERILLQKMLRKFGMTVDDYNKLLAEQGGVCAICKKPGDPQEKWGRLAIDHDHQTMKIRGLLHLQCNTGIGMLKDSPTLLEAAAAYLRSKGK